MKTKISGASGVLYLSIGGLIFAGTTFLIVFITSPQAASPKQIREVRISPMPPPPKPKIPPLSGQATVTTAPPITLPIGAETATESAEVSETKELLPSPESTGSAAEPSQ